MNRRRFATFAFATALLLPVHFAAAQNAPAVAAQGFYRFPTLRGDTVVFAAEGDLWAVPTRGGLARRITTHPAQESDPVLSPDGKTVAFTARYEGPVEAYTMPIEGGVPVRRTYEAEPSTATAWTPTGELVYACLLYTSPSPRARTRSRMPSSGCTTNSTASIRTLRYALRP